MSLECSECERDLRGGHGPGCQRFIDWLHSEADKTSDPQAGYVIMEAAEHIKIYNAAYDRLTKEDNN